LSSPFPHTLRTLPRRNAPLLSQRCFIVQTSTSRLLPIKIQMLVRFLLVMTPLVDGTLLFSALSAPPPVDLLFRQRVSVRGSFCLPRLQFPHALGFPYEFPRVFNSLPVFPGDLLLSLPTPPSLKLPLRLLLYLPFKSFLSSGLRPSLSSNLSRFPPGNRRPPLHSLFLPPPFSLAWSISF